MAAPIDPSLTDAQILGDLTDLIQITGGTVPATLSLSIGATLRPRSSTSIIAANPRKSSCFLLSTRALPNSSEEPLACVRR